MVRKLTAVSLFSGCGGFDYGVHKAGVEIVWANDIDSHAAAAYQSVLPRVRFELGDIQTITTFPKVDVLIGCYPCTGLSLAARRRWKNLEPRNLDAVDGNFLYWSFLRALAQIRPRYFFVENVLGMLTADKGWFFDEQLNRFRQQHYKVKYQLLDASEFGVAQSRRRVFIVGVRNDIKDFDYEFPSPTHGPRLKRDFVVLRDVIASMPNWPDDEYFDYHFHGHYLTRNRKRAWDQPSYTIVANGHHVPLHPSGRPMKFVMKDTWELQGRTNRRLSWRECLLIQGLPSKTVPTGNLMDKYRVIGNAVPPALGRALLAPVVRFENSL